MIQFLLIGVLLVSAQTAPQVPRKNAAVQGNTTPNIQKQTDEHNKPTAPTPLTGNQDKPKPDSNHSNGQNTENGKGDSNVSAVSVTINGNGGNEILSNILTGLLVVVGGLTFWAIWKQARDTAISAAATQASSKAIQEQVGVMRDQNTKFGEQIGILRDQTPAIKNSADAALLNAQAAISAARPWISFFGAYSASVFTCKAANMGNTPAQIISYASEIKLVDRGENLPIPPVYGEDKSPSLTLLMPARHSDGANLVVGTWNVRDEPAPDPEKQILALFFRVIYSNPLSGPDSKIDLQHESRMCFLCDKKNGHMIQNGGPQEYNTHT